MNPRIAALARAGLLHHLRGRISQDGVELRTTQDEAEFCGWLRESDAALLPIFHYSEAVARAMHDSARLKWVQFLTVGTERLRASPAPAHVQVTTAGPSMAPAIAEHAMALLLALSRRLPISGATPASDPVALRALIRPLQGSRLAILGYGAIGREVATRARAFGMHVTGLRRAATADGIADEVRPTADMGEVLAASDAVVVSAPLTPATRGLLGAEALARCKRGALIMNVSRGAIVDTDALVRSLESGHLGGAGLDVTEPEPLPPAHALTRLPNVILTPHVAAAGAETSVAAFAAANVRRFLAGEPLEALLSSTS